MAKGRQCATGKKKQQPLEGFTLLELLVVLGIVGILASITLVAINPSRQLSDARDAERRNNERNYGNALEQYVIGQWERPASVRVLPSTQETARPICKRDIIDPSCVNLDVLVPEYIAEIPVDPMESADSLVTGYAIYEALGQRLVIVSVWMGSLAGGQGDDEGDGDDDSEPPIEDWSFSSSSSSFAVSSSGPGSSGFSSAGTSSSSS